MAQLSVLLVSLQAQVWWEDSEITGTADTLPRTDPGGDLRTQIHKYKCRKKYRTSPTNTSPIYLRFSYRLKIYANKSKPILLSQKICINVAKGGNLGPNKKQVSFVSLEAALVNLKI